MQARVLGNASDPNVVARTPGVYVAPSTSLSYGVLMGLVDVGDAEFLGETYLAGGELAIAVAVGQARRNVQGQITIGSEFFMSALRDYGDWAEKWWREAIQNAVDAGGTEVDCVVTMLDDAGKPTTWNDTARTIEVSCQDNGRGMDEDTLLNKFLVLGGTTKTSGDSVGGFGKAKELLLLPWIRWHLHSRNLLVEGHGIQYDVKHLPNSRGGTGITVWMPPDRYTRAEDAVSFLKKCWIPGVHFTVNGETVRANQKVGQVVEGGIAGKIEISYKKTSKDFSRATCLVRSRGLYMFDRWVSDDAKGVIIVEVVGPSIELLTANRDGFRDYECRRALDDYVNRLAADVKSATKGKKNIVKKKFAGTGKFRSKPEQVEAAIMMSLGSLEPLDPGGHRPKVLTPQQTDTMLRVIAGLGTQTDEDVSEAVGLDLRATVSAVEAMLDIPVMGPSHVEAIARQLAWEPDFYVYNEIEEFHVPKRLMPEGMTPQVQKLARFWAELCRFVLIQLGSKQRYGVGWHFDRSEEGSTTLASYLSDDEEHWLMLNPFLEGDTQRGELYSLSDRDHVNWLYAAAVHECTHMADGITRHNEAFAGALTRNVARTANRGRQIEQIRKTVVARGAKIGKLGELEGAHRNAGGGQNEATLKRFAKREQWMKTFRAHAVKLGADAENFDWTYADQLAREGGDPVAAATRVYGGRSLRH